ncbi:hypothetical protein LFX25_20645 [Leptospira sp. FAT2]|uniref:hypothetical protein n=1 Tax=Leptospira sanjuanensis TaxID=2879643 RepID=UPI001EE8FA0F|nr:hypothetical protein [Leptospira sanjuanensis]MCG6195655.1 hypothetical protein [Leptospira sanjuanensis]
MPTFLGPFSFDEFLENAILKNLFVSETEIDFSNPLGSYNLGEVLGINSLVSHIVVKVILPFDGNPVLTIGDTTSVDKWFDEGGVDLSEIGVFFGVVLDRIESTTQAKIYWNPKFSSKGKAKIFLFSSSV